LVHAPKGSFPSWYAATHSCGLVVDTPSPTALAGALRLLARDGELRNRLAEAGLRMARAEFDAGVARRQLAGVLGRAAR
jgi:glycosyltransferase involved in cell wall biosynthesis